MKKTTPEPPRWGISRFEIARAMQRRSEALHDPEGKTPEQKEIDRLLAENVMLKARLAKHEKKAKTR